jgi:hypothetical protein
MGAVIEIDDAGWGCIVGGVIIGAYRKETGAFAWGEVPVELFQWEKFGEKAYLQGGAKIAKKILGKMECTKMEEIHVCTGFCLDGVAEWLIQEGYRMEREKITGSLQELIEGTLLKVLQSRGLKIDYGTLTERSQKGKFWWKQMEWLKRGNPAVIPRAAPDREKMAKTGWATYRAWGGYRYQRAKEEAAKIRAARKRGRWIGEWV